MPRTSSTRTRLALAAALLAPAGAALAQDSTSITSPGLAGDAVDPHLAGEQQNDYVVDLAALRSSWGNVYGVAPIAKASADFVPAPAFFNALISAQALSVDQRVAVPFPRSSYAYWDEAGRGVNDDPTLNTPPSATIDASALVGNQLAFAFAEFSSGATVDFNNIVSGAVNYELDLPSRLYVSRVMAAVNSPDWSCNLAQVAMGGVDSDGFVHFRADNFGTASCGGFPGMDGNNWFRVDTLARSAATVNVLSNAGGVDATTRLLQNLTADCAIGGGGFPHTHSPPTCMPSSVTGGLPVVLGSAFSCAVAGFTQGQYLYGSAMPLTVTTSHLAGATDSRGTVSYSKANFPTVFPGATSGTAALLSRNGGPIEQLQLWGLSATGAPIAPLALAAPSPVTDNADGFSTDVEFTHYFSQTAFRGGNGQVAVGRDQQGRLIAAATAEHPDHGTNDDPDNAIVVARVTPGGATEWTIAAWTTDAGLPAGTGSPAMGKVVLDGPSGAVVGTLSSLDDLTGGMVLGPGLSPPMIDSVGNVWFTGVVAFTGGDIDVALLRAVYDPAAFRYDLEVVLAAGEVLAGQNSARDYEVRFLTLSDGDSLSSGATFSGNICQDAYAGLDPSTLDPRSSDTLGGLVLTASIVYDRDQNGVFETLADNPATLDEQYESLLFVTSARDCNDNGVPDDLDIARGTSTDIDGDGIPDECGPGTALCFGDGSGTPCPCGNTGAPGTGCANSSGAGAVLAGSGTPSLSADSVVLLAQGALPGQPGLFFQGENNVMGGAGSLFGDGLRCCGFNVIRLATLVPDGSGSASSDGSIGTDLGNPVPAGPISQHPSNTLSPGDTRCYQFWYRDPSGSPCGATFNLTNAFEVTWLP